MEIGNKELSGKRSLQSKLVFENEFVQWLSCTQNRIKNYPCIKVKSYWVYALTDFSIQFKL
jgi:hypothetical protein